MLRQKTHLWPVCPAGHGRSSFDIDMFDSAGEGVMLVAEVVVISVRAHVFPAMVFVQANMVPFIDCATSQFLPHANPF